MNSTKRNKFLESILYEMDTTESDNLTIYYEDLTDDGKAKVLDAINNSDELLDVFGDPKTRASIEDSFYGNNGKNKIPLMLTTGDALRSELDI